MAQQAPTGKEMGLIKVASKHKQNAEILRSNLSSAEKTIVKLAKIAEEKYAEEIVWEYVCSSRVWWLGQSGRVGVLTKIKPYENKNGDVYDAHYTECGTYLYRVSKEKPSPYSYVGYFRITAERFRFEMNREAIELKDFFQPNVESIEPLPVPKKVVRCSRPKVAKPFTSLAFSKVAKPVAVKPKWDDDE